MGRFRRGILLVLLVLLVLLAIWWSAPGAGPPPGPQAPVDTGDAAGARRPGVPMSSEGREATRESDEIALLALGEPPRRSGPPDLGPELGGGLGPGLGLSEAKPKIWMTGRLVDADGKPLSGISVRLEPELHAKVVKGKDRATGAEQRILEISAGHFIGVRTRSGRTMAESAAADRTDEKGHFEIPAPPVRGNYRVVFARGRSGWDILIRTGRYRYTTGARASLGTVTRPAGGSLTGRVTDVAGRPIAGTAVSYWPETWGMTPDELLPPGEAPVDEVRVGTRKIIGGGPGLGSVETDDDGRFTIRNVFEGTHTVTFLPPGHRGPGVTLKGIEVREGHEVSGLTAVVDELLAPLISGRVFSNATGEPIRASVHLRPGPGMWRSCSVRHDGRFVADRLEPGEWQIRVFAVGHVGTVFGPYSLSANQRLEGLELRLEPTKK